MITKPIFVSIVILLSLSALASELGASQVNEDAYNQLFCVFVGGQTEVRHDYNYPGGKNYVKADCETADTVYEGGLDKRSSLDSVQQALFCAHLTGKRPVVVIYDTDGKIGRFEYQIKTAAERAGVAFLSWIVRYTHTF